MQAPKNRQEFLSMQQQAAAAARDMQRRATLPMPPRQTQDNRPSFRQSEPLHHKSPTQQARQAASYGRMQPQMRRQEWQAPPGNQGTRGKRSEPKPQFHQPQSRQRGQPQHRDQPQYQEDPRFREPPSPPPPPPTNAMPPLADLLGMLGGLGNLGGPGRFGDAAAQEGPAGPESVFGAGGEGNESGGMDSIMILLLLFLLQKENADQGLLLALMYIMM